MRSLILRTATRFLLPLLMLYSVLLLLRGHHEPGGGFVGGLIVAAALGLGALAYDAKTARRVLPIDPGYLIGGGLLTAVTAGLLSLLQGKPFLTAIWTAFDIPGLGHFELGTPVLFDVGVYLTVIGVVSIILLTLVEET